MNFRSAVKPIVFDWFKSLILLLPKIECEGLQKKRPVTEVFTFLLNVLVNIKRVQAHWELLVLNHKNLQKNTKTVCTHISILCDKCNYMNKEKLNFYKKCLTHEIWETEWFRRVLIFLQYVICCIFVQQQTRKKLFFTCSFSDQLIRYSFWQFFVKKNERNVLQVLLLLLRSGQ